MKRLVVVVTVISFVFTSYKGFGQEVPSRPDTIRNVYDFATVLSKDQQMEIEKEVARFGDSSHVNIIVVSIPTIEGHKSVDFANELAEKWKIFTPANDHSVLLLFADQQRVFEMVAGKDVKHIFTEVAKRKIQKRFVEDNFRENNYFEGINEVVFVIGSLSNGTIKNEDIFKEKNSGIYFLFIPLFLFFFLVFPFLQYRALHKTRLGSKPLSFYTALSLMNTFGGTGRSGYEDFAMGKGDFKGAKSGGGGATGDW